MPDLLNNILTLTRTWGFTIWVTHVCLAERKQPWRTVERSLFRLPMAEITPREAYNAIVDNNANWYPLKICQDASRQTQLSRSARNPDAAVW